MFTDWFEAVVILAALLEFAARIYQIQLSIHLSKQAPSLHADWNSIVERYDLTKQESKILSLLLKGDAPQEIADQLYIAVGTVRVHIHNIYQKMGITRRSQLNTILLQMQKN